MFSIKTNHWRHRNFQRHIYVVVFFSVFGGDTTRITTHPFKSREVTTYSTWMHQFVLAFENTLF